MCPSEQSSIIGFGRWQGFKSQEGKFLFVASKYFTVAYLGLCQSDFESEKTCGILIEPIRTKVTEKWLMTQLWPVR